MAAGWREGRPAQGMGWGSEAQTAVGAGRGAGARDTPSLAQPLDGKPCRGMTTEYNELTNTAWPGHSPWRMAQPMAEPGRAGRHGEREAGRGRGRPQPPSSQPPSPAVDTTAPPAPSSRPGPGLARHCGGVGRSQRLDYFARTSSRHLNFMPQGNKVRPGPTSCEDQVT